MAVEALPSDLSAAHRQIITLSRENEYLKEQLRLTRERIFGRSSEKRPVGTSKDQTLLFGSAVNSAPGPKKEKKSSLPRRNRQSVSGKLPEGMRFPAHLPRRDEIIDEGEGEVVFEKITERLAADKKIGRAHV